MAFQFFRTYQKPLLFGAGIFALVSFSISTEIFLVSERLFRGEVERPSIRVAGKRVEIGGEDYQVARLIARTMVDRAPITTVLPPLGREDAIDLLAAYRRVAVELGIGLSRSEARAAMEKGRDVFQLEDQSLAQLALRSGFRSLQQWEDTVAEALRIGTVMRMEALGVAASDAELAEKLVEDIELVTLQVASLSKESIEEELRENPPTDEELAEWIDGLEEFQQQQYAGENKASLRLFAVSYADFDASAFTDELEGVSVTDAEVTARYELDKALLYRRPEPEQPEKDGQGGGEGQSGGDGRDGSGNGGTGGGDQGGKDGGNGADGGAAQDPGTAAGEQPGANQQPAAGGQGGGEQGGDGGDQPGQEPGAGAAEDADAETAPQDPFLPLDDALRARIKKGLEAEAALSAVWKKVQAAQFDAIRDRLTAREEALQALSEARKAVTAAEEALDSGEGDQAAVDAARAERDAKQEAFDAAEEALDEARAAFDAAAAFEAAVGGRSGFVVVETEGGPKTAKELQTLPEPIGEWKNAFVGSEMEEVGALSTAVQHNADHGFVYQVTEAVVRPRKPMDEIREQATEDYITDKADEIAEEKKELLKEKLLDLGKAANAEKVAELEAAIPTRVDEKMDAWKSDLEATKAKYEAQMAKVTDKQSRAYRNYSKRIAEVEAELAAAETQREEFESDVREQVEKEIEELASDTTGQVLTEAAEAAGFELTTIGPLRRDLSQQPRFRERHGDVAGFLFGSHVRGLEEGDATDVLEDFTNRTVMLAVCTEVQTGSMQQLTRRNLLQERTRARQRLGQALQQSYTMEAVEKRWGWRRAGLEPVIEPGKEPAKAGAVDGADPK